MKKYLLVILLALAPQVVMAGSQTFIYTGGAQYFTVPTGVTSLTVQLWGAGGANASVSPAWCGAFYSGGAGGYTTGTLAVTPGQQLVVVVGGSTNLGSGSYGGGGIPSSGSVVWYGVLCGYSGYVTSKGTGGVGGGRTAIQVGGVDVITAAGGGGAGSAFDYTSYSNGGGAGGGAGGGNGSPPSSGATGGTQSSGGSGGTMYYAGSTGGFNAGGAAANFGYGGAGGGGGGWYGGGGGEQYPTHYQTATPHWVGGGGYGGGGGSGYCSGTGISGCSTSQGAGMGSNTPGQAVLSWTVSTPICSISITPNPLGYGSSATLSWSSSNATSFYINSIGYVGASGSTTVAPGATTDYSGSVSGPGGSGSCPASLAVNPPPSPSASIGASASTIYVGQSATVTATFAAGSGDTLTADNIDSPAGTGLGANTNPDASKTITFTPSSAGTYTFYARATTQYYSSWATYAQTSVTVDSAPQCSVSLNPTSISQGQSATLSYSSSNAISFSINNVGSITPNTSGKTTVSPSQTTDYTGTATAGNDSVQCPASLTVSCTPTYTCSGQTIQYTDASCNVSNVTTCVSPAFCQSGSSTCLYPAISFNPNGNLTGHLQLIPDLVVQGKTSTIDWNVSNAQSCTVTGTNGDSWTGLSGSHQSGAIMQQTIYTLSCTAYGSNPNVSEKRTVNVAPLFQER